MIKPSDVPIIDIPDEILLEIGRVTVVWGILETVVDLSIAKLAGFNEGPNGAIITAHMAWPLKMDVLEALIVSLRPEHPHLGAFSDVKPQLKKAQDGRNRTAHGSWGMERGQAVKLRATARGKLKVSMDVVTVQDLETIKLDIYRAGTALLMLVLGQ